MCRDQIGLFSYGYLFLFSSCGSLNISRLSTSIRVVVKESFVFSGKVAFSFITGRSWISFPFSVVSRQRNRRKKKKKKQGKQTNLAVQNDEENRVK